MQYKRAAREKVRARTINVIVGKTGNRRVRQGTFGTAGAKLKDESL